MGKNIKKIRNTTQAKCQKACSEKSTCVGVEFFQKSGKSVTSNAYREGDCLLNSGANTVKPPCDAAYYQMYFWEQGPFVQCSTENRTKATAGTNKKNGNKNKKNNDWGLGNSWGLDNNLNSWSWDNNWNTGNNWGTNWAKNWEKAWDETTDKLDDAANDVEDWTKNVGKDIDTSLGEAKDDGEELLKEFNSWLDKEANSWDKGWNNFEKSFT